MQLWENVDEYDEKEGGRAEEDEEDDDQEEVDSDGIEDEIEKPWWYAHLDLPSKPQECVYCGCNFIVGNCGTEYDGRGYCYECMDEVRRKKASVWFKVKEEEEDEYEEEEEEIEDWDEERGAQSGASGEGSDDEWRRAWEREIKPTDEEEKLTNERFLKTLDTLFGKRREEEIVTDSEREVDTSPQDETGADDDDEATTRNVNIHLLVLTYES